MSRRVSTGIPILDKECLIEALSKLKRNFVITGNVITIRDTRIEPAQLIFKGNQFLLTANEHEVESLKKSILSQYQIVYEEKLKKAEEEKKRLEEERRLYIESQKTLIIQKAKKLGYVIKETNENDTVKLVLVKRVY